jgi:molybdate transport system permease protein
MNGYLSPLWISIKTVLVATTITFFLGIVVARWMAHYSGKLKSIIEGLFLLPLVLPPTVVGLVLLILFGKNGPIGKLLLLFGTTIIFSWPATVLAAVVVSFPLMYMTSKGAFEQVESNVENAARTLGASEWRVFWTVTLPLAWPGVAAGTVLAFARALGEFGATIMIAGDIPGRTATLPIAIYFDVQAEYMQPGAMQQAWVLVGFVMVISLTLLFTMAYWRGRVSSKKIIRNKEIAD